MWASTGWISGVLKPVMEGHLSCSSDALNEENLFLQGERGLLTSRHSNAAACEVSSLTASLDALV